MNQNTPFYLEWGITKEKMKTFKIMIFVFLSVLVNLNADNLETHKPTEKEFLGIYLGSTMEELREALKVEGSNLQYLKTDTDKENGSRMLFFTGNHRLKNVTATLIMEYKGKVASVAVIFHQKTDSAKKTYETYYNLIERKYGNLEDQIVFGGSKAKLADGSLYAEISHDIKIMENDTVYIVFAHLGLMNEISDNAKKSRMENVGDF